MPPSSIQARSGAVFEFEGAACTSQAPHGHKMERGLPLSLKVHLCNLRPEESWEERRFTPRTSAYHSVLNKGSYRAKDDSKVLFGRSENQQAREEQEDGLENPLLALPSSARSRFADCNSCHTSAAGQDLKCSQVSGQLHRGLAHTARPSC